jgi:two-component system chemotaxis response regulator CheB
MDLPTSNGRVIRVLLVDDSFVSVEIIRRMLASAPEIQVVGSAGNGVQALELIPLVRPDVICTDLHMPVMNGLELIREVMARHPLPMLVLSVSVQAEQADSIFQMLEAGALDILAKPRGGLRDNLDATAHDLIMKIRILAGVKVIAKRRTAGAAAAMEPVRVVNCLAACTRRIIGVGASTGGPQALSRVLGHLPAEFPLPLVCVQHIAEGFMRGLVCWLSGCCRIGICIAEDGMRPIAGNAYFAPDAMHLEIDESGVFRCSRTFPDTAHRPSVDIVFRSLARQYGATAVCVLLTGMGVDGAQGMLDLVRAGGLTIAQDEPSSVVFGMPRRAIELGGASYVLPLEQIGPTLCDLAAASAPRARAAANSAGAGLR